MDAIGVTDKERGVPFANCSTGAMLHYEDTAPGDRERPVVLAIHGWLGTGRQDLGEVIDWLAGQGYRVIAPSRRGYGLSQPKPRDYPPDFYHRDAADMLALMDALGLERIHLMGYSDGGETALVCAGLAPARFRSVIAWGAVGAFDEPLRPVFEANRDAAWIGADLMALHGFDDPHAITNGWADAMLAMLDAGGDVSLGLAPRITCPVLLMLGEGDRLNPVAAGERFVRACPDGGLVVLPCGHPVHRELPAAFHGAVLTLYRSLTDEVEESR
jgi:valacyclovir hydrolase